MFDQPCLSPFAEAVARARLCSSYLYEIIALCSALQNISNTPADRRTGYDGTPGFILGHPTQEGIHDPDDPILTLLPSTDLSKNPIDVKLSHKVVCLDPVGPLDANNSASHISGGKITFSRLGFQGQCYR